MTPRVSRSLLQLIETPPQALAFLGNKSVVMISTSEALRLAEAKAHIRGYEGKEGQKWLVLRYGGKNHLWIAGITTDSYADEFPVPREKWSGAETEESGSPTQNTA